MNDKLDPAVESASELAVDSGAACATCMAPLYVPVGHSRRCVDCVGREDED